jgi:hypothetical protein
VDASWTAPTTERADPGFVSGERQSLEEWLEFHRQTLFSKCAGLNAEQLKTRAVPPSNLSLLGLVRHMTEVERWWFRMHADAQDVTFLYCPDDSPNGDFDDIEEADAEADLAAFLAEIEAARAAVAGHSLEEVVPSRGDHPERVRNIRWIYVHMIEEYARHNGHADLLRELTDGATGD